MIQSHVHSASMPLAVLSETGSQSHHCEPIFARLRVARCTHSRQTAARRAAAVDAQEMPDSPWQSPARPRQPAFDRLLVIQSRRARFADTASATPTLASLRELRIRRRGRKCVITNAQAGAPPGFHAPDNIGLVRTWRCWQRCCSRAGRQ